MYNRAFQWNEGTLVALEKPELGQVLSTNQRAQKFGALDLGSNSFHLIIAEESHGRIKILDRQKETIRLAEGITKNKQITKAAEDRALACLMRFAERLQTIELKNIRAVGTSAFRRAPNSRHFFQKAEKIIGKPVEVLSGNEEARLIYKGACSKFKSAKEPSLVIDIGGGSTEIIIGKNSTPISLTSVNIGCIPLSREFFPEGIATKEAMKKAASQALAELGPVREKFVKHSWKTCLGASGTIETVFSLASTTANRPVIDFNILSQIREHLVLDDTKKNKQLMRIPEDRRAVFPGGLAILIALFETLDIKEMQFSDGALREGLLEDMFSAY